MTEQLKDLLENHEVIDQEQTHLDELIQPSQHEVTMQSGNPVNSNLYNRIDKNESKVLLEAFDEGNFQQIFDQKNPAN